MRVQASKGRGHRENNLKSLRQADCGKTNSQIALITLHEMTTQVALRSHRTICPTPRPLQLRGRFTAVTYQVTFTVTGPVNTCSGKAVSPKQARAPH